MALRMNDYNRTWNPSTRRWMYEHRQVAEQMVGRPLKPTEHVHHKDHDPRNNSPDNLVILSSRDHLLQHPPARKQFHCDVADCPSPHYAKGLCRNHYRMDAPVIEGMGDSNGAPVFDGMSKQGSLSFFYPY